MKLLSTNLGNIINKLTMEPRAKVNNKTIANDPWNCQAKKLTRIILAF
jgi:hypothetical protein